MMSKVINIEKKLINAIHNNFIQYTSKKISKKEIKDKIIPIFLYLNNSKKNMFLFSGCQGIGKTTIVKILSNNFYQFFGKKILSLRLDDFYYDKIYRKKLSKLIHPLMITRGVPGTHNISEILNIIKKFNKSQYPIEIPIFDKLNDKRLKKMQTIKTKFDILILEGWCCGSPPLTKKFLQNNLNILEKEFDKDYIWRNYYNNKLKYEYLKLFKLFQRTVYFQTSSFTHVLNWRLKQENKMKKRYSRNKKGMNKNEIAKFIQHYEKITRWMMKVLPKKADLTLLVDKKQKIKRINENIK